MGDGRSEGKRERNRGECLLHGNWVHADAVAALLRLPNAGVLNGVDAGDAAAAVVASAATRASATAPERRALQARMSVRVHKDTLRRHTDCPMHEAPQRGM